MDKKNELKIDMEEVYDDVYIEMLRSFKVEYTVSNCPNCGKSFVEIKYSPVIKDGFCCEECYNEYNDEFHFDSGTQQDVDYTNSYPTNIIED